MRHLIVGLGSIGRRHFQNLLGLGFRDLAVVEVRKRLDEPQQEFFAKYKPRVFFDLGIALGAERPDAVFVCNPTSLHISTALRAVRAGAHVFIEKPISHSRARVDELLREAARHKRVLYVGYNFRHHPLLKKIKQLLDSGKLGKIYAARFVTAEYLPGWHPWEDYRKGYAARHDLGGGVVLTQSHDLDLIYWFFGRPRAVAAVVQNSGLLGIGADDVAVATFTTERCPVVTSHLDYLTRPPVKYFTISGSQGHLQLDYYGNTLHLTQLNGRARLIKSPPAFERNHMYITELKDFLRCIRHGRRPIVGGAAGRMVLEMALRAQESSRRRRMIKF